MPSVRTYIETSTHPSRKPKPWIFVSGFQLTPSHYNRNLTLTNLWFYHSHWIELFHQCLHRQFFSWKKCFLFKIFCCKFNLSILCHSEGKSCSVIAPLVLNVFLRKFTWFCPWCEDFVRCREEPLVSRIIQVCLVSTAVRNSNVAASNIFICLYLTCFQIFVSTFLIVKSQKQGFFGKIFFSMTSFLDSTILLPQNFFVFLRNWNTSFYYLLCLRTFLYLPTAPKKEEVFWIIWL